MCIDIHVHVHDYKRIFLTLGCWARRAHPVSASASSPKIKLPRPLPPLSPPGAVCAVLQDGKSAAAGRSIPPVSLPAAPLPGSASGATEGGSAAVAGAGAAMAGG